MSPEECLERAATLIQAGGYNPCPESNGGQGRTLFEVVCVAAGLTSGPEIRPALALVDSAAIDFDAIETAQLALGYVCNALGMPVKPGDERPFLDRVAQAKGILPRPLRWPWALGVIRRAQADAQRGMGYRYYRHGLEPFPGIH